MPNRYPLIGEAPAPSATLAPGQAQELTEPRRAPSVHSDVTVPFVQAFVTALVCALIPFALIGGALIFLEGSAQAWEVLGLLCLGVFAVALAKAWFWRVAWVESTIDKLESLTGVDLNGDGEVEEAPHWVTIRGQKSARPVDPLTQERHRFTEFVRCAFQYGTTFDALKPYGFERQDVARYRNLLMRQDVGCAAWNSTKHNNGGWHFAKTEAEVLAVIDSMAVIETIPVKR